MKRACALALALSLLAAAGASAKGGVIFDRYPDVQAVGSPMRFTVMVRPGVRPLLAFRDQKSATVVRVRASKTDLNGVGYGTVRLPSHGPWDTRITVAGRLATPADAEPFRVGVGLTQTTPPADAGAAAPAGPPSSGSAPWGWIAAAAVAALASALTLILIRRRPRGAA